MENSNSYLSLVCSGMVLLTVLSITYADVLSGTFSWHPILMTIAYMVVMTQSILSMAPRAVVSGVSRKAIVDRHYLLNVIAALLVLLGFSAILR